MENFSKETLEFLSNVAPDQRKFLTVEDPGSSSAINPGNILIFRYRPLMGDYQRYLHDLSQRIVLVVRCERGPGLFDGKYGKLVSCFKLDDKSEEIVDAILYNLYKKRRRASYYGLVKQSLTKILGKNSFRTYYLQGMIGLYKFSLAPQKVRY